MQWVKNLTAMSWVATETWVWSQAPCSGLRIWQLLQLQLRFDPWPWNFHMPQEGREIHATIQGEPKGDFCGAGIVLVLDQDGRNTNARVIKWHRTIHTHCHNVKVLTDSRGVPPYLWGLSSTKIPKSADTQVPCGKRPSTLSLLYWRIQPRVAGNPQIGKSNHIL